MLFLNGTAINIPNFCPRHRGKVVGFTTSFYGVGSMLMASIYVKYIEPSHSFGKSVIVMTSFYVISGVTATMLLKDYSHLVDDCTEKQLKNSPYNANEGEAKLLTKTKHKNNITGCDLFKRLDYHLLFFALLVNNGFQNLIKMNTVIILKTYDIEKFSVFLFGIVPLVGGFFRFGFGALSDMTLKYLPRTFYLAFLTWVNTLLLSLTTILEHNKVLIISSIASACMTDIIYTTLISAVVSEMFGEKYFSINMGIILLGYGIVCVPILLTFGIMYDKKEMSSSGLSPGGSLTDIFMICGVGFSIAALISTYLAVRERRWRNKQ